MKAHTRKFYKEDKWKGDVCKGCKWIRTTIFQVNVFLLNKIPHL